MLSLDLPAKTAARPKPKASFAGATTNRLTADWYAVLLSADKETRGSLRTLRARSRQLVRDNAHANGMIGSLGDNVVGAEGIGVQPKMKSPRGKPLKSHNDAAWAVFQRWGEAETCVVDAQLDWPELQRLALTTWATDGEVFVRKLPGFDNAFGYALQLIDADYLDESYNVAPAKGQGEITQGIEIDRWGKPIAYHFWANHPSDGTKEKRRMRLPAEQVIHLFTPLRPNQRRGIPILTPILIALKMLDGYTEAEVTQARIAAAQGGFFYMTGEDARELGTGDDPNADPNATIEMEAEPGLARKLPPGWQFKEWDTSHPNANFGEFQKAFLRMIGRGVLRMSAITVSGDLSDTSYSSGRVGLVSERDSFKAVQRWLGHRLVKPVYRDVIRYASMTQQLALPTPEPSKWLDLKLEPRGWPWIDPKAEAVANEMKLANKLTSPQRILAEEGVDIEDVLDEWQEYEAMLKDRDLTMPEFGKTTQAPDDDEPAVVKPAKPSTNGNGNGHGGRISGLLPIEVTR